MIFWNSSGIFMLRSICQGGGYHLKVNMIKGNPPVPKETKLPLRLFIILRRQGFSINVQIHYEHPQQLCGTDPKDETVCSSAMTRHKMIQCDF